MSELQTSANLPLAQLRVGHNHRKYFDEAKLAELTASVKKHGVLQPILVRPLAKPAGKVTHETVAGERRYRAAKAAGLKEIPVVIRELTDKEALEVGLVENLRREDVLPLEEAEGYRELHVVHGESVEQIAERVGKSKEYVYGRMKLCELKSPAVKKALDEGKLSPSTALLIARIPMEKLQEQAAERILRGGAWDDEAGRNGPMSFRSALRLVEQEYQLSLSKAPFNTKDANLVPEAGACGACPKRTGNCKELYPEVKSENVCTDPECFGKKKAAAFKAEAAAAREKGQKLLKDSKSLWSYDGKELSYSAKEKYVELDDKCPGDKKGRTFKQLLGDEAKVVLARDPNGKKRELLEIDGLQEALEAAGHKIKLKEKNAPNTAQRYYEKERKEQEFRTRVMRRLLDAAAQKLLTRGTDEESLLRLLVAGAYEAEDLDVMNVLERRYPNEEPEHVIKEGTRDEFWALLMEAQLSSFLRHTWDGYEQPLVDNACSLFGVKLEDLEKEQRQADAAAPAKGEEKGAEPEAEEVDSASESAEDGED